MWGESLSQDKEQYYKDYMSYIQEYEDGNWDFAGYEESVEDWLEDMYCDDIIEIEEGE